MAALALALFVLYLALAVGARMLLHKRRTGSSGLRGIGGRPGPEGRLGPVLSAQYLLLAGVLGPGLAAPVLDLGGVLEPVDALGVPAVRATAVLLCALGFAGTLASQLAMGASWRIGVDESEKTGLVTGGPFALVRNPIFAAMTLAFLGLALMVPNAAALAGFAALVAAVELQVRFVEEPYLLRTHGEGYARYASRVGRFVPGFGRLKA